ncbi:DUF7925 domain-containing protein [Mastigocladopsis repens]|uniref:DUF7925 domain-containing protein n=1 Tax=Mastigocladopsis repens TaxID=221287 RepID=UPI000316E4E3|nr:hypothetical protein [Mastigocladopsis repens]
MSQHNKFVKKPSKLYRSLVTAALIANGIFQFVAPVLAQTAANQEISNTATATYQDPDGNTINATSNTVTVTVAEVAGIEVTARAITDTNGGKVQTGDTLYYEYTVKNVGNDPTKFHIPAASSVGVTGPGTVTQLEYSTDNGATWIAINDADTTPIAANASIEVRATVTVNQGATLNDVIRVTLGDTGASANTQNQPRTDNAGDVYTVDAEGTPGDVVGAPVNGTREASAFLQATVEGSSYALATVLKKQSTNGYDNSGTARINDDKLSYDLSLRVELNDPTGNNITTAPLVGTTIKGFTEPRILVSDAIPKDTELAAIPTGLPAGWQAVYTTDPVSINANDATWQPLTAATNLATVTRVGFVNDPATVTSVAPGTTVTGFSIQVKVKSTVTASTFTFDNIAQLFGQTLGGTTLVYDESGDSRPSNFNDDGTIPPGSTDTNGDKIPDSPATIDDGYINDPGTLAAGDIDGNNDNTGTGPGGEVNQFQISATVSLIIGPNAAPQAVGPTDINNDFTNKAVLVPSDKSAPGSTYDPAAVTFKNTVQNTGNLATDISLVPTAPTTAADLPANTLVTITYNGVTKAYLWTGTEFRYDADGNAATADQSAIDATSKYITVPSVPAGSTITYDVKVDLPDGTALSTDSTDPEKGYPVPLTAFIDDATPGLGTELAKNTTIDRIYTGYLKMVKESQVLKGTGPDVQGTDGTFSTTAKKAAPGNIIEYRITYTNVSEAPGTGTGNVTLNARNIVITEDGTVGSNNWAKDTNNDGKLDTSNVPTTAKDSGAATIRFFNGTATAGDDATVTKYEDAVTGEVAPGENRTFGFQRQVN